MAPSNGRYACTFRGLAVSAIGVAWIIGLAGVASADMTGKWRFRISGYDPEIVDVTQTGSSVSFPVFVSEFGGFPLSGNRLPPALIHVSGDAGAFCSFIALGVVPSADTIFFGWIGSPPCGGTPPYSVPMEGARCECVDGNTINGDGCDDHCQIEPCFTCTGDPSVCTPTPDGGACDDDLTCTTGETCQGGVCGYGGPVSPCVDLSGAWLFHESIWEFSVDLTYQAIIRQQGTSLTIGGIGVGDVNPATGSFVLYGSRETYHSCFLTDPDTFTGASTDNKTLEGTFAVNAVTPGLGCGWYDSYQSAITGNRCGGGTLDEGEECDDGNDTPSDGCSPTCQIEQCYNCSGDPSVCAPIADGASCNDGEQCTEGACAAGACVSALPVVDGTPCDDGITCMEGECAAGTCISGAPVTDGTPCDDGDVCTDDDSCVAGSCAPGAPDTGTPCEDGDACTNDDVCTAGICTAGPPKVCPFCQVCGPTGSCIAGPSQPCDDGNACTDGDSCFGGHCAGGSPVDCGLCLACDPADGCKAAPKPVCREPAKPRRALLVVDNKSINQRDSILFKWRPGDLTATELGSPLAATGYALCVYDESGAEPALLFRSVAQPANACAGCWESKGDRGYLYNDPLTGGEGLVKLQLGASTTPGRGKVLAKGKGTALSGRPFALPVSPIPLPLRVQVRGRNGACFQSRFTQATVTGGGKFKARGGE